MKVGDTITIVAKIDNTKNEIKDKNIDIITKSKSKLDVQQQQNKGLNITKKEINITK